MNFLFTFALIVSICFATAQEYQRSSIKADFINALSMIIENVFHF